MFTLFVLLLGLLFYWKPIYYAIKAYKLYYKVGEDSLEYINYRAKFIDWFRQAWSLVKP